MEKIMYSKYCHLHKEIMTTAETKRIRSKGTNKLYEEPLYFCGKCKTYYYFIKGIKVDCKIKYASGSNKTIHVLDKADSSTFEKKIKIPDIKTIEGKVLTEVNQTDPIVLLLGKSAAGVQLIPDGIIIKNCSNCGSSLCTMYFNGGKDLLFSGKQCPNCSAIYVPESEIREHSEHFKSLKKINRLKDLISDDISKTDISEEKKSLTAETDDNSQKKTASNENDSEKKKQKEDGIAGNINDAYSQKEKSIAKDDTAPLPEKLKVNISSEESALYSRPSLKKKLKKLDKGQDAFKQECKDLKHITER